MNHLEFCDKLTELGVQIHSTIRENQKKTFGVVEFINFECSFNEKRYSDFKANQELIRMAIDIDEWKHSMHNEITNYNYEKFREIIQDKILKRAKDLELLTTAYFQIQYEISKNIK